MIMVTKEVSTRGWILDHRKREADDDEEEKAEEEERQKEEEEEGEEEEQERHVGAHLEHPGHQGCTTMQQFSCGK